MLVLCGCKPTLEQKVIGFYSIDDMYYEQEPFLSSLEANIISFNKDGTCNLPIVLLHESMETNLRDGFWSIHKKDTSLIITTNHPVFNGTYNLRFEKDYEEKLLKLVLENENIYLRASKGLQNFDLHKDDW